MSKDKTLETDAIHVFRGEPGLFDVEGWRRHIQDYEGDEMKIFNQAFIAAQLVALHLFVPPNILGVRAAGPRGLAP